MTFDDLIKRMIRIESGGNPRAVSPVGAVGLMQIMPASGRNPGFGLPSITGDDLYDPQKNRAWGEKYMQTMLDRYDGDTERALVAYNWGPGNADKWDGRKDSLPGETRKYVDFIVGEGGNSFPGVPPMGNPTVGDGGLSFGEEYSGGPNLGGLPLSPGEPASSPEDSALQFGLMRELARSAQPPPQAPPQPQPRERGRPAPMPRRSRSNERRLSTLMGILSQLHR